MHHITILSGRVSDQQFCKEQLVKTTNC
eukprot:UN11919